MAASDPSHNVHPDLLPHIHLISAYRYPLVPRFGIPDVTEWLLNVPRIAREGAPFFWTYLDTPQDGSIILTWQPLQRLGTEFASDGYVWPRGEVYYQHEIRDGLILEVFHQPVGYRPGDEYAMHSRRRFRLMPPKVPNPNAPQVDPSLWLVHYGPIDEREPVSVKKIRVDARQRTMMENRANLQRAGQITRKEFMLSDRVNWPHIPLPRDARGPPGYTGAVPQQMAYPPHGPAPMPGPPTKRARHAASQVAVGAAGAAGAHLPPPGAPQQQQHMPPPVDASIFEDEEDYSRGDMFDAITPRDVSLERYRQNHEWMEEIISSPYRIGQIGYADLGLGLKGELAPVTEGIFESQAFDASQRVPKKPYVGRLDSGLADEFRKRANEKIAQTEAEIAEMKAKHEKLVASFQHNSVIKKGEHDLRFTAEETGAEVWRVEGRLRDAADYDGDNDSRGGNSKSASSPGDDHWTHPKPQKTVDEVVSEVEHSVGRKVVNSGTVVRVQDGGFREPTPEPEPEPEPEPSLEVPQISVPGGLPGGLGLSQHPSPAGSQLSGIMIGDADIDMGDAAGMLDQMESVFSNPSTPLNFSTPAQAGGAPGPGPGPGLGLGSGSGGPGPGPTGLSNVVTASGHGGASPAPGTQNPPGSVAQHAASMQAPTGAPGQSGPGNDWVVVPPGGGVTPPVQGVPGQGGAPAPVPGVPAAPASEPAPAPAPASTPAPAQAPAPAAGPGPVPGSKPPSAAPTPGGDDFGPLVDLDTTGIDDGLDLDMEDSAFGDAFHGSGA